MARRQTPEEQELMRKLAELGILESTLAQRELDLATLQLELRAFESLYLRIIGTRYAEMDEMRARIAEARCTANPDDPVLKESASQARARAKASSEAIGPSKGPRSGRFDPPEGIKRLYREVAKLIHPDLCDDGKDRDVRRRLMAEANHAYADGDVSRLEAILYEWQSNPDAVKGEGTAAELVRVIRKIAKARSRLGGIASETEALKRSPLFGLRRRVEEHEAQGRHMLDQMARALDLELKAARDQLADLIAEEAPRES